MVNYFVSNNFFMLVYCFNCSFELFFIDIFKVNIYFIWCELFEGIKWVFSFVVEFFIKFKFVEDKIEFFI